MPLTLTDDNTTYPANLQTPSDGDLARAADFTPHMQKVANRTAFIKRQIDYIDPNLSGVRKIRNLESIALLKAVTGMVNREVAIVPSFGLYQYIGELSTTEVSPNIIAPNVGSGRWLRSGHSSSNIANGVAALNASTKLVTSLLETNVANGVGGLDASAKLLTANMHNAIIGTYNTWHSGGAVSITGSGNISSTAIALTLAAGDIVLLDGAADVAPDPTNMPGAWVYINSSAQGLSQPRSYVNVHPTQTILSTIYPTYTSGAVHWKYTASAPGTHTFYTHVVGIYPSSSVAFSVLNAHLRATHIRP